MFAVALALVLVLRVGFAGREGVSRVMVALDLNSEGMGGIIILFAASCK